MTAGNDRWAFAERGAELQAVRRGDGAWLLQLPAGREDRWGSLIAHAAADLAAPLLINTSGDDHRHRTLLRSAGFAEHRTEQHWRLAVAPFARRAGVPSWYRLLPLDRCDLPRVVELDNTVRRDIPGTETWTGTLADLIDSTADEDFDPALYLIAEHSTSGCYDGLIRVWNRHPDPRLGCLGVRVGWRRTRLAGALLAQVASVLLGRGVSQVTTETDVHNRDSHPLAARWGTPTGMTIQWLRPG